MNLVSRLIGSGVMAAAVAIVPVKNSYADPRRIGNDDFLGVNVETYVDDQRGELMFVMTPENINVKNPYIDYIQPNVFSSRGAGETVQLGYSPDGFFNEIRNIKPIGQRNVFERLLYNLGPKVMEGAVNNDPVAGLGVGITAQEMERQKQREIEEARNRVDPSYKISQIPRYTSVNNRETAAVFVTKLDPGGARGKVKMGVYITWAVEALTGNLPHRSSLIEFNFDNDVAQAYARENKRQENAERDRGNRNRPADEDSGKDEKEMKDEGPTCEDLGYSGSPRCYQGGS
ncbi:hypothetical protein HYT24_03440 [Candidatus Pacearchaeota archaeon]|nr:hypothetical protein [Candidatus Pacearchaeota archaeon]